MSDKEKDEELDDRLEKLIQQKTKETSALKNLLEELSNHKPKSKSIKNK